MKRIERLSLLFLAVLTVSACQKENSNRLIIEAESMSSGKMAINGNSSYWVSGDNVYINGVVFNVNLSDNGQASVDLSNQTLSSPLYGIYPANIYVNQSEVTTGQYTINIPNTYTYTTCTRSNVTYQNLQSPMVAYKAANSSDNRLFFKHLTGAITVEITNNFGFDISVTDVTISSNKYQLSGPCIFNIPSVTEAAVGHGVSADETNITNRMQVQMTFNGSSSLTIASGETKPVQIPVLPVGSDNRFTVSVTVQSLFDANKTYTFTKTQPEDNINRAIARAQIGYAPAKFGGVFSVGNGSVVRFSPGNLQYQTSNSTWHFASNQYDIIGSNNSNINNSQYDGRIDLFGWGTGSNPTLSTEDNQDYSDFTNWGANVIINGGNIGGMWRTLTNGEWISLIETHYSQRKIGRATVQGVTGIVILPVDFEDPMLNNTAFIPSNSGTGAWYNSYTSETWNIMESAGAIFLPTTGVRNGTNLNNSTTGYYWSSSHVNNNQAYGLSFDIGTTTANTTLDRYLGCAVRLVRVNN